MKILILLLTLTTLTFADAPAKLKMYFNNEEILKIIEMYSKASGQKFVVDPGVRGKISIFLQEPVGLEEAFNQMSSALAINGYAISKQGDTMIVKSARNIQRDLIEVSSARPALKPERMYTWIYTLKNVSASKVMRDLRILSSKDGEMVTNPGTNQLVLVDWASNLNRIGDILKELDKKADPEVAKLIEADKFDRPERHEHKRPPNKESKEAKVEEE